MGPSGSRHSLLVSKFGGRIPLNGVVGCVWFCVSKTFGSGRPDDLGSPLSVDRSVQSRTPPFSTGCTRPCRSGWVGIPPYGSSQATRYLHLRTPVCTPSVFRGVTPVHGSGSGRPGWVGAPERVLATSSPSTGPNPMPTYPSPSWLYPRRRTVTETPPRPSDTTSVGVPLRL